MADERQIATSGASPFDAIRHVDEQGNEYWSARELGRLLGYTTNYRNFQKAIKKAEEACENSGEAASDHIAHVRNMISIGKGGQRLVEDVHLSRYGAYLIVQNADPEKPIVALGQTYFAVQTRRQELADQMASLPEDQKRLLYRSEMAILNQQLNEAAKRAGVVKPEHFGIFTDHGYKGLYAGETENMIHTRKNLREGERILDFMGSDESIANAFRASLARQRLDRDNVKDREQANQIHFQAGRKVRQTIEEFGGTMPEDLPTPEKSIQQLQREEQQRLIQGAQLSLFDENKNA
jgi:DNA-damage-inducible protein D